MVNRDTDVVFRPDETPPSSPEREAAPALPMKVEPVPGEAGQPPGGGEEAAEEAATGEARPRLGCGEAGGVGEEMEGNASDRSPRGGVCGSEVRPLDGHGSAGSGHRVVPMRGLSADGLAVL
jgi:hypothetical protein